MKIEDVKQIPIADYLHSLGYSPVKQQGNGLWYKSPLREEHEPSFKVNTDRNLWYDFGAGKGGNIIALAKELYCSDSLPYLLNRIAEQTPHVRPVSFFFPSVGQNRASSIWKSVTLPIRHCSVTCRDGVSMSNWQKENVRNSILPIMADRSLLSVSRTWQEVTRFATPFSKAASPRKTSPTYGSRESRGRSVWCSRVSWTTSLSLRSA